MLVTASTRCFSDKGYLEACQLLTDLEYDKVELWFDESGDHLKPSQVCADIEGFYARYKESTRLTPVAFCVEHDVEPEMLANLRSIHPNGLF